MLLFVASGFALTVHTLPDALNKVETITTETFLKGKWTAPFEKVFTEQLPVYDPARQFWGTAEYALFHDGRPGVVIGKDGWLFTSEEFKTTRDAGATYESHLSYIEDTARALNEKGVKLAVALIPAKTRLYTDELDGARYPVVKQPVYEQALTDLAAKGVSVINVRDMLAGHPDAFLKTDTHWSQDGARLAAAGIADSVRTLCPDCIETKTTYKTEATGEARLHDGDLLRYVPVTPELKTTLMQDRVGMLTTEAVSSAEPAAGDESAGLFGDQVLPVVLVGTSYSANTLFNFAGYLKQDLGTDIINAAKEGQGPFVTMKAWRESSLAPDAASLPKLVIWEVPERYLTMADKDVAK